MFKSYITLRTQREGFHAYTTAPEEVAFLRNLHRHLFKFELQLSVQDLNRELEFFIESRAFNNWLDEKGSMIKEDESCEMCAKRIILDYIHPRFGGDLKFCKVTVSEDGENDGTVEWIPSPWIPSSPS